MGFASWVCRITVNRFVFVSKICHLKVALVSGESNVYFFQTVRSAFYYFYKHQGNEKVMEVM